MNLEQLHQLFLEHPTVSTDTRKITPDCLFFALKGPNFNGNEFASEALKKGAAYAVVDEKKYKTSKQHILVEDVLESLQKLSTFHRNYCNAKIIALTGSNGKTTTKELIYAVLSKKYNTIATQGNLNNHIGVPLTLLSIKEDTEIAVVEMGANHQKEIAFLSSIAQPDFGYITNFGKAHLEGFGGVEGVIKGKSELYDHLMAHDEHIFMNADDPIQLQKLESYVKKIGYSTEKHEYYTIKFLGAKPFVSLEFEGTRANTQLVGDYNFSNCCVAVLIGKYFNVPVEDLKTALESYVPDNNRSQIIDKNGIKVVLDAYNANPTSMRAAVENFKNMEWPSPILVLGDMFELGESAAMEHQSIADLLASKGFERVFLVGENFYGTQSGFMRFKTFDDFKIYLESNPITTGNILIKGSRGMALERTLDLL
ncbi:UDP-N-acetylmuramoyl-tripeptide--D-alanyl-D-alanine ligase [Flagellimonas allohymeniacidonis]|uniref:UDP-N-acetylmuramoyl-tripeptide--D-alanyl-D-alanine ligase n=1 Tax=Flagellimonas allohymeniacidonis TaxID=2517819 RepID=A0A4Q8QIP6_9FLAO|nr:UDP-N-acetylmuramoyl-tripeptide--D-alanyl-D-alanine ligase [Allomuricauda hymeniacidonis]TAI49737.1 UDP-N-acetylmuramoyl-tripeptide--D-alanyl-D-alanine ligase [Allomuricauda hymeniacidonis]